MQNILVIGSLNLDYAIRVKDMPLPGETILGEGLTLSPGGKGGNQAFTLGRFGRTVAMIGACLLYTSPSPRDRTRSRMPSSA